MMKEYKTEDEYEMILLEDNVLNKELTHLTGWKKISDQWIAREYTFDKYLEGVNFAKQIGEYAEKRQHHPTIIINYKKVTIEISSWRAKGVTELDIEMVKDFNDIYNELNEK